MDTVSVTLIGAGFRSHTFARIINALPQRFRLAGAVVRNAQAAAAFAVEHHTTTWHSLDEADLDVDVVVVAVPRTASVEVIAAAAQTRGVVLAETPPGDTVQDLERLLAMEADGLRIQVAEQYHLEPLINAQLQLARCELLGTVDQAHISVAHGYHGVSVLRRALGVGAEDAEITATAWPSPVRLGPSRYADPDHDELTAGVRTMAWLDFGDRRGCVDFDDQQYRNWVRSPSVLIRGSDGELRDTEVRYVHDYQTPMHSRLIRVDAGGAGNHEGMFLRGYTFNGQWLWRNPYPRARLADDDLSIAAMLDAAAGYLHGGPPAYSLAEAAQDRYLDLAISRAADSGERVRTRPQAWSSLLTPSALR